MISTKGRYAIRIMIDLAEQEQGKFIPLKDVAEIWLREGLSSGPAAREAVTGSAAGLRNTPSGRSWI